MKVNKDFLVNDFLKKVTGSCAYYSPGYPACNLLYYIFVCVYKPEVENIVVETGTCYGVSTIVMAQAIKDLGCKGRIYTVELIKSNVEEAEKNIKGSGLENYVQVVLGDSKKVLKDLVSNLSRLDFVFLDGDHSTDAVCTEFNLVKDLVRKSNGYIYFDNVTSDGVYKALQKIKSCNSGNLVVFPNCSWSPPGQAIWSF